MFFACMSGASLYLALLAPPSCGCLGSALSINPRYALLFDLVGVGALLRWPSPCAWKRATWRGLSRFAPTTGSVAWSAIGAAAVLTASLIVLHLVHPAPEGLLAALRGESLQIEPSVTDLGRMSAGEEKTVPIRVRNATDHPIRILGGSADCSCVTTQDLPLLIAARQAQTIRIRVRPPGPLGTFRRSYILFTNDPVQPRAVANVVATLVEEPQP